jgi:serine/threonine protein kinase
MATYDQKYTTVRRLGEGGFGVVYLVRRKVDGQVRLSSRPQKGDTINDLNSIPATELRSNR